MPQGRRRREATGRRRGGPRRHRVDVGSAQCVRACACRRRAASASATRAARRTASTWIAKAASSSRTSAARTTATVRCSASIRATGAGRNGVRRTRTAASCSVRTIRSSIRAAASGVRIRRGDPIDRAFRDLERRARSIASTPTARRRSSPKASRLRTASRSTTTNAICSSAKPPGATCCDIRSAPTERSRRRRVMDRSSG